jgi:aspartate 1-decarboxylase
MNGGCARHVQVGDTVIIFAFAWLTDAEAKSFKPKVVFVDDKNQVTGGVA